MPGQLQLAPILPTAAATSGERRPPLSTVGLFSGIGGLELGLARAGHHATLLCENDPGAIAVLRERFPDLAQREALHEDVCTLEHLPAGTELIAAGFPCQDLSQAGMTAGIKGARSGLVDQVFRLLRTHDVPWVLLENVPFMLQLDRGRALDHIVTALEELGYRWAYRVIDSRSMGLPQRRERVFLLASKVADPCDVLFVDDAGEPTPALLDRWRDVACGFYWTEGLRGLGWAHDAVPTLKGGSTIGIASPPAVVLPSGEVVQPDLRDLERLQGFDPEWTAPSSAVTRTGHRWKLVGNAVTVDVAAWVGEKLRQPGVYDHALDRRLVRPGAWPKAAWGVAGERHAVAVSTWPVARPATPLASFLRYPPKPLSAKATAGFVSRAKRAKLRFPPGFLDLLERHLAAIEGAKAPLSSPRAAAKPTTERRPSPPAHAHAAPEGHQA